MTKKLTVLFLALILCLGLLPSIGYAGEPTWVGGNPSCQHLNCTGNYEPVDESNHQYKLTCGDCGAKGTLPFDGPEPCKDENDDNMCDKCNRDMSIQATEISSATVNVNTIFGNNTEYLTGSGPIQPSVSVYDVNGVFMYQDSDYSVSYGANNAVGTGTIKLTGLPGGRLKGSRTVPFTIKKFNGNLAASQNTVYLTGGNSDGTFNYTGSQIKPTVMVELDDNGTLWDSCYSVNYGPNIGPGQNAGSVTITGTGETAYGVPITGTRTVYFNIVQQAGPCQHPSFTYVSASMQGHYKKCNVCKEQISEIEGHTMQEGNVTIIMGYFTRIDTCSQCPYTETIQMNPAPDLGNTQASGLKGDGEEYTEDEAYQIGLDGLTEGVDYTKTVSQSGDNWQIVFEPIQDKAIGEQTVTVKKACPHIIVTYVNDGTRGHHAKCNACGKEFPIESHDMKEVALCEVDGKIQYNFVCQSAGCGQSEFARYAEKTDLSAAEVQGVDNEKEYTRDELSQITLKGLTEGVDYVQEATGQINEDGTESWVVKFKPADWTSTGEQTVTVKKKEHTHQITWNRDNPTEHWQYCTVNGCDYINERGAHVYDQGVVVTAATCTENAVLQRKCKCGRVDPTQTGPREGDPAEFFAHHNWGDAYESDYWDHWQTCTRCGAKSDKQAHVLTNISVLVKNDCITNGSITADCAVCGRKGLTFSSGIDSEVEKFPALAQYKALGHDFSGPLRYDRKVCTAEGQGNHAPTCIRCGIRSDERSPHAWTGLHTLSNGSCSDPNDPVIQEASCECGATLHLEKPREHMWVDDKSQDVEATCTEPGKINGQRCMICGTFGNYDFAPALGHDIKVLERVEPTCEKEGFEHRICARCDLDETETLKTLSPDGHHHFEPVAAIEPTCTKDGQANGEKCIYCPATQGGETGYGIIPALGHKVVSSTASHGKTRTAVGKDGRPIEIQVYVTTFSCSRCGASLGGETFTVAKSIGKMGGQYRIEPGVVTITDMENGIHVNGNMAKDGGVYFNGVVQDAYDDVIKNAGKKYTYKKTETKSFVIEFTDEFLDELEDGEYEMVVINGSEYWPMMITVRDHRFKALREVEIPDMPELTEEEFNALLEELKGEGEIIHRFFLNQPVLTAENGGRPDQNGNIVATLSDGDYAFDAIVNGDYTLEEGKDYRMEGGAVTLLSDYLSTLSGAQEIVFRYQEIGLEGAPLPHNPILTIGE